MMNPLPGFMAVQVGADFIRQNTLYMLCWISQSANAKNVEKF
jgi:hypothetical protein